MKTTYQRLSLWSLAGGMGSGAVGAFSHSAEWWGVSALCWLGAFVLAMAALW